MRALLCHALHLLVTTTHQIAVLMGGTFRKSRDFQVYSIDAKGGVRMNLFDKISYFVDDVADVVNGAIGTVVCGAADVADTVSYRGKQIVENRTGALRRSIESKVDVLKP
ncbi:hypothetical protein [uncultured Duncaniella sp.]|uniref:hypothetical protein n=1 Tax=uncultured Duncaniella sp. TaxID=2768039 RepID=UPI00261B960F|nr:hypothetical protein [uncultured Duncaniella sp.]